VLQEVEHAEIIRALKVEQAKELTKLRQEFEMQARELGSKYEKKMKMLREDLELRRKQEIHEIEEHKVSWAPRGAQGDPHAAACNGCFGWVAAVITMVQPAAARLLLQVPSARVCASVLGRSPTCQMLDTAGSTGNGAA
jgi:hypothetical protein